MRYIVLVELQRLRREHGIQSLCVMRSSDTDSYINIYKVTSLRQGPIVLQLRSDIARQLMG